MPTDRGGSGSVAIRCSRPKGASPGPPGNHTHDPELQAVSRRVPITTLARAGLITLALASALLSACVTTSFRPDPSQTAAPGARIAPADVRVLKALPAEPYRNLGAIETYVSGHQSSEAVLRRARKAAAAGGTDAIVPDPAGTPFIEPHNDRGMQTVVAQPCCFTFLALRLGDSSPAPR